MSNNYPQRGHSHGPHGRQDRPQRNSFNEPFQSEWITQGITDEAIAYTETFAKELVAEGLTTSQIRNFFGEVRRLQMKLQQDPNNESAATGILLLRPKLAYAAKRKSEKGGTRGSELLQKTLDSALKTAGTNKEQFNRFVDLFESILAFHKVHGGK